LQDTSCDEDKIEIWFMHGWSDEVFVVVKDLSDIDIDVVHSITGFEQILALKAEGKRWSEKSAEAFIKALEDDGASDGPEGGLAYSTRKNGLYVSCDFKK
jgi:hypothetical protein